MGLLMGLSPSRYHVSKGLNEKSIRAPIQPERRHDFIRVFLVYLMKLSLAQTVQNQTIGGQLIGQDAEEAIVDSFEVHVLFHHLPRGTDKNHPMPGNSCAPSQDCTCSSPVWSNSAAYLSMTFGTVPKFREGQVTVLI